MREPKFDPKKIYRFDAQTGRFFIDVDLDYYRELYSQWDFSPQRNRDLDADLLEYLRNCCEEIPRRAPLSLTLSLPQNVYNPQKEARATEGFDNFFTYLVRREKNRSRNYYSIIIKFLIIGALLLVLASLLENYLAELPHSELLVEGLIIGAWVSIWEVFSVLFFKLSDHRKKIAIYHRLQKARIDYRYRSMPTQQNPTPDEADLQS